MKADVAVTHNHLRKLHGTRITRAIARSLGVAIQTEHVAPTAKSRANETPLVTFHVLRDDGEPLSAHQLRHYAGTAAIREALGVPPEQWESSAGLMGHSYTPDAIWSSPNGPTPIEFDAGSYDRHVIISKMTAFQERYPTRQVWGAATPARVTYLEGIAAELRIPVQVVLAIWFD